MAGLTDRLTSRPPLSGSHWVPGFINVLFRSTTQMRGGFPHGSSTRATNCKMLVRPCIGRPTPSCPSPHLTIPWISYPVPRDQFRMDPIVFTTWLSSRACCSSYHLNGTKTNTRSGFCVLTPPFSLPFISAVFSLPNIPPVI